MTGYCQINPDAAEPSWRSPPAITQLAIALILIGASTLVAAEDAAAPANESSAASPTDAEQEMEPLWEVRLAAFTRYGPSYPASEDSQFNIVPAPFPIYRGRFLRVGDDSEKPVRGRVFRRDRIKLDLDFAMTFGSDSDDIDARKGMPDLDIMLEVGPELELEFTESTRKGAHIFLALPLRAATSFDGFNPDYRGMVFAPEVRYRRSFEKSRSKYTLPELKLRVTPTWASNRDMDYFYKVQEEFATETRDAFDAKGGYIGTEFSASMKYPLSDKLELWGGVTLGYHGGAKNEDSPLFTDKFTESVYVAFIWRLWESKTKVPAND
jgi:outer membrane protein